MKRRHLAWILCAISGLAACSSGEQPAGHGGSGSGGSGSGGSGLGGTGGASGYVLHQDYERLAPEFDSMADCAAAQQQDPLVACTERFSFCAGGHASWQITDIIFDGTYQREGDVITVQSAEQGKIIFTLGPGDQIVSSTFGPRPFAPSADDSASFCAE